MVGLAALTDRRRRRTAARAAALAALQIVPFTLFGESVEASIERFLAAPPSSRTVAAAVFGALAVDVVAPIPSSLVAVAAGVLLGSAGGFATVSAGLMAGNLLGYGLGRMTAEGAGKAATASLAALPLSRGVPVLSEGATVVAGAAGMPPVAQALAFQGDGVGLSGGKDAHALDIGKRPQAAVAHRTGFEPNRDTGRRVTDIGEQPFQLGMSGKPAAAVIPIPSDQIGETRSGHQWKPA
jgi:hypothetical protein